MKKIVSLIFNVVILMSSTAFGFPDLTEDHWAYQNVMDMHNRGFVSGFLDNTFKPNDALTRAQFITMLVKSLGIEDISEVKFDDIDNH